MQYVPKNKELNNSEAVSFKGRTKNRSIILEDNRPNNKAIFQRKKNDTNLPDNLKSGIENLSGIDMSDTKVHYNSNKPAQLNAHAYAQGTDIHLASGQEKHLPHEAWHVVQQKQGRVKPTNQLKEKVNINDDESLEKEADVMGEKLMEAEVNQPKRSILKMTGLQSDVPIQGNFYVRDSKGLGSSRSPDLRHMQVNQTSHAHVIQRVSIGDAIPLPDGAHYVSENGSIFYVYILNGTVTGVFVPEGGQAPENAIVNALPIAQGLPVAPINAGPQMQDVMPQQQVNYDNLQINQRQGAYYINLPNGAEACLTYTVNGSITLSSNKTIYGTELDMVSVPEEHRRHKLGQRLLDHFIQSEEEPLILECDQDGPVSEIELRNWYRENGFEVVGISRSGLIAMIKGEAEEEEEESDPIKRLILEFDKEKKNKKYKDNSSSGEDMDEYNY
ncbi:DUF4157 domain-containing protein [uncultured Winogradskyella sp.]|uniref:eCIS core domain-containing protein n=1 Tax=uncultured Winogradskyella sp. TaxID=395353 RepID=UPI002626FF36|nr:DUF4157 domain-containing protein [uncultured Winogradskyella sp.]